VILLLFEAVHTHPAAMCPLLKPEGKAMFKQMFSDENLKKGNVKMTAAYLSCPKETGADHKGFFTMEADSAATVSKFFGAMAVEVRLVQALSDVAKTL
jgi:hypothetical protein